MILAWIEFALIAIMFRLELGLSLLQQQFRCPDEEGTYPQASRELCDEYQKLQDVVSICLDVGPMCLSVSEHAVMFFDMP